MLVWRIGFEDGGCTVEDGVIGPFRSEEAAERKADAIRKAIAREVWDEEGDQPDGVSVQPLIPGRVAAREAVVAHLVHDLG